MKGIRLKVINIYISRDYKYALLLGWEVAGVVVGLLLYLLLAWDFVDFLVKEDPQIWIMQNGAFGPR